MTVRKIVHSIAADQTRGVVVLEHDLGPDVIVQVRKGCGRVLKMRVDVLLDRVLVHCKVGMSEEVNVVIIG